MNVLFLGICWNYPTTKKLMSVNTIWCQLLYLKKKKTTFDDRLRWSSSVSLEKKHTDLDTTMAASLYLIKCSFALLEIKKKLLL